MVAESDTWARYRWTGNYRFYTELPVGGFHLFVGLDRSTAELAAHLLRFWANYNRSGNSPSIRNARPITTAATALGR